MVRPISFAVFEVAQSDAPMAMASISPSAFCLVRGSPATWHSSVRRGSNILRNSTLPECPPVAMMTPRRAWILTVLPSKLALIPCTLPEVGLSRVRLVILWRRRKVTPFARALASR